MKLIQIFNEIQVGHLPFTFKIRSSNNDELWGTLYDFNKLNNLEPTCRIWKNDGAEVSPSNFRGTKYEKFANKISSNIWLIPIKYINIEKKNMNEVRLPQPKRQQLIKEFIKFCVKELGIKSPLPKVIITNNKNKTETYGHFNPSNNEIVVYNGERSFNDMARTVCHELIHERQRQQGKLNPRSGEDGSPQENEANSVAGVIMRKWGKLHPEAYE